LQVRQKVFQGQGHKRADDYWRRFPENNLILDNKNEMRARVLRKKLTWKTFWKTKKIGKQKKLEKTN